MADDPVAEFCAELRELRRGSRRGHTSLATELSVSRTHLYAILNGEVRRPPDFTRFVEPFVRACGGDDKAVAEWRQKHDTMERAYEEQRRSQRQSPDEGPPPEPATYEYARPRPRWVTVLGAVLGALLIAGVSGTVAAKLAGGSDEPVADPPATAPPSALCPLPAPATGANLLDALPDEAATGDMHHRFWWASNGRVWFQSLSRYAFDAKVTAGMPTPGDLIIVRSCVPLTVGRQYRLSLTVRSDRVATLRIRVQDNTDAHTSSHQTDMRIGTAPTPYTAVFTGAATSAENEVTFQVGGNPDFQFQVSDVKLVALT